MKITKGEELRGVTIALSSDTTDFWTCRVLRLDTGERIENVSDITISGAVGGTLHIYLKLIRNDVPHLFLETPPYEVVECPVIIGETAGMRE